MTIRRSANFAREQCVVNQFCAVHTRPTAATIENDVLTPESELLSMSLSHRRRRDSFEIDEMLFSFTYSPSLSLA